MIPLVDLAAQQRAIKDEIAAAIARVLESSSFVLGDEVAAFETEFAAFCEARYAVAVNSGTSALHLALLAAGVGAGDEVITAPNTFIATCEAISYTGARPVFVDVRPDTYTIDVARLEAAITPRTRAIIPVHLYGQPADLDPIVEIAQQHRLALIEDACQAHGAALGGRRAGSFGTGCFSLYATKNITTGEGGIITTDDSALASRMRRIRSHGEAERYSSVELGFNYRLTDVVAAIGVAQLDRLQGFTDGRRR
ncbi:MAG TPA: DegT/DnrJ/EryC1/StrS family aminotransferase, partial [Methylomirabilota bacterium]